MITWKKTTEERYWEMLGVVPPRIMTGFGFLVGEPMNHTREGWPTYSAFVEWPEGNFWEATRPLTLAEFKAVKVAEIGVEA